VLSVAANAMIGAFGLCGVKRAIHEFHGIGTRLTGRPPMSVPADDALWPKYLPDLKALWAIESGL
jgi:hypothetical protein